MSEVSELDCSRLAQRLTAYAVLAHDPAVPGIAADYWEKSETHYRTVDGTLRTFIAKAPDAERRYQEVLASPTSTGPQHALRESLTSLLEESPADAEGLAGAVAEADQHIWIDYHLGTESGGDRTVGTAAATEPAPSREPAEVRIVIPFRDRESGLRTRNLLACLQALEDQEGGLAHRVTVVESDTEPRTRQQLEPLVDRYVFAPKEGLFNKAWAVNVGAVDAASDAPYLCVLDADILVDRAFVARNAARLREGGHGIHLPFRWSLSLDEASTRHAIGLRTSRGDADVPDAVLRGLLLREPPGGCVWLRTEIFHAVGGFDERYEGWGGEDDDVIARLTGAAPLRRFDDQLLHLNHPRPEMTRDDGVPFNAGIEPLSWHSGFGYGDPGKFTPAKA
ncbi:glycosyltransferase family 2 protein [Streptomyces sp. NPDC002870]|uniref:glycosyltransferase family 2 protein n=1 Tax=Streptomyces sp. NPDC002870 TaxID=3364666 RepID=UPI0036872D72